MSRFPLFLFAFFWLLIISQNSHGQIHSGDIITETAGRGLVIRSNPTGAKVFIDDIDRGETPLQLSDLGAGTYDIRLEKDGCISRWLRLTLRSGSGVDVFLELEAATGRVLLDIQRAPGSPSETSLPLAPEIFVEGRHYQAELLELPAGFRNIHIRAFGWEPLTATLYVETGSFSELALILRPAVFSVGSASISRIRFNPANSGVLGAAFINFEVSAPGGGTFSVYDGKWNKIVSSALGPFNNRQQSIAWNGRNENGDILPDGSYTVIVEVISIPWDDSDPVKDGFVMELAIDSSSVISPLTFSSGKSGFLFAPLPSALPAGSFQLEGSLLGGSLVSNDPWESISFSLAFRISPVKKLELSAALNPTVHFNENAELGVSGGVKWVFIDKDDASRRQTAHRHFPFGAAAGAVFSWTGNTALTPFGMACGIELFFPLELGLGKLFSLSVSPAALWTGPDGFPLEPIPRLLISGGLLMRLDYLSAGFSIRSEFDFNADPLPPFILVGGEIKIFPPPSSFVFSLIGGMWRRGNSMGGFGGVGIGMIY